MFLPTQLRLDRQACGLTQHDLAVATGTFASVISQLERGLIKKPEVYEKLTRYLAQQKKMVEAQRKRDAAGQKSAVSR